MDVVGGGFGNAAAQLVEIEASAALVNLHGIAAAHSEVRLRFSLEINEFTADARAAIGLGGDADGLEASAPDVGGDETSVQSVGLAGKNFRGFGGFDRSDHTDC